MSDPQSANPKNPESASSESASATADAASFVVATWNVNSLRMRMPRLLPWLAEHKPDVVCLQEIKLQEPDFPLVELLGAGYHAVALGQKTYNGVAVLSRVEHGAPTQVVAGLQDDDADPESRLLAATIPGLGVRVASVYVPQGQEIDSDKFAYKRRFLARLLGYLERRAASATASEPLLLCGDYNIAPDDLDVYDPIGWRNTVITHSDVRQAFERLKALGYVDTLRKLLPGQSIYSYWDYRGLSFPKNLGLRIDHILAPLELAERCTQAWVDRQARKGEKPSDHAPVLARFRR